MNLRSSLGLYIEGPIRIIVGNWAAEAVGVVCFVGEGGSGGVFGADLELEGGGAAELRVVHGGKLAEDGFRLEFWSFRPEIKVFGIGNQGRGGVFLGCF